MSESVDPDQLEQVEFSVVRRGLDPASVRSTLAEAADGLRLLKRRCHELEHRAETLEEQVPEPDVLERERETARAEGREAGEAEGERQREDAMSEAEAIVADAKEEGRRLVGEAQTVRRRMLEDLARRRRALRQEIEQLRGGRERLLEAYEVVGHTLREATSELSAAMPEARAAAERAGHGVGPEESVEQLEAEIESARMAGLPIVADQVGPDEGEAAPVDRPRPVAVPLERDVRDMPEVEPVVADFEEVRVLSGDGGGGPAVAEPNEPVDDEQSGEGPSVDELGGEVTEGEEHGDRIDGAGGDEKGETEGDRAGDAGTADTDRSGSKADLFTRLRHSQSHTQDQSAAESEANDPSTLEAESMIEAPAAGAEGPTPVGNDDPPAHDDANGARGVESATQDELDRSGDAAEPFGLVLGVEPGEGSAGQEPSDGRATAQQELARRLKRLLSDEQNDVLDRLRRTRKRTVSAEDLLDDLDTRVTRFADAVEPVLAAASAGAGPPSPVDDLAAELAREVAEAVADGLVEPLEEEIPAGELSGSVRALYRKWKTDRIGALAQRYVEAAGQMD